MGVKPVTGDSTARQLPRGLKSLKHVIERVDAKVSMKLIGIKMRASGVGSRAKQ